jgi:peptidoglycan L-alanyl-D-glutamate endopeptidase CwlK
MTTAFKFGTSSLAEIKTVHPLLQKLCYRALALSPVDFRILQGIRTAAEQLAAYKAGYSRIKSGGRHQVGCAVDFMVVDPATGKFTFSKPSLYAKVRAAFYAASAEMKIPIRTLEKIGDLGHIELTKSFMPDNWKQAGKGI